MIVKYLYLFALSVSFTPPNFLLWF